MLVNDSDGKQKTYKGAPVKNLHLIVVVKPSTQSPHGGTCACLVCQSPVKVEVEPSADVPWLVTGAAANIRAGPRQEDPACGSGSLQRCGSEKRRSRPGRKLGQLLGHAVRDRGERGGGALAGSLRDRGRDNFGRHQEIKVVGAMLYFLAC